MLSFFLSVVLISAPIALAKNPAADFDKSVTTGNTVSIDTTDLCQDFKKITVPDAAKVQQQCGESVASYVRFAEGWLTSARGSGDQNHSCRTFGKRYSAFENRHAQLQNCGASCERDSRALYRELSEENKGSVKAGRKTPTVRDAHVLLVAQAKKRESEVQANGKAYCEQQLSNAKHAVELVKLGYEQILVNYGELADAVLSDMAGSRGAGNAPGSDEGAGTSMDVKSAE